MTEVRHLPKAPITEALIDIRVKPASDFDINIFDSINEDILESFPIKEKQEEYSANIRVENARPIAKASNKGIRGFFYKTKNTRSKRVLEFIFKIC